MPSKDNNQVKVNFNVDPLKTPVLFVDSYLIATSDHALTLNFAQATPAAGQQQIVARVALSRSQAKEFLKNLSDHIEKFEI